VIDPNVNSDTCNGNSNVDTGFGCEIRSSIEIVI